MKKISLIISALFLSLFLIGCGSSSSSSSSSSSASEGVDLGSVGEVSPVN